MTEACRVLVIGRNGQLARELARAPWPSGWTVRSAARSEINLADPEHAAAAVTNAAPDVVVNAAAYTNVEQAESEPDLARAINATGPAAIAAACADLGASLVSVSTDYVFDGRKTSPYVEDDPIHPLSVYGQSKAEGEAAIRAALPQHVILRTSWVFSPFGTNFVRTMQRLGAERPTLRIVADQHGRPTAASDLARAIVRVCETIRSGKPAFGTYHVANADATTWYAFAGAIFEGLAARDARVPTQLDPIASAEYPTKATRPANSVLDCTRFERAFGMMMRPWRDALPECLDELAGPRRSSAAV